MSHPKGRLSPRRPGRTRCSSSGAPTLAQLWHPYVSHSAQENGPSEPISPPSSPPTPTPDAGLCLHLQAVPMVLGRQEG